MVKKFIFEMGSLTIFSFVRIVLVDYFSGCSSYKIKLNLSLENFVFFLVKDLTVSMYSKKHLKMGF